MALALGVLVVDPEIGRPMRWLYPASDALRMAEMKDLESVLFRRHACQPRATNAVKRSMTSLIARWGCPLMYV